MPEVPSTVAVTRNITVSFVPTAFKRGKKAEAGEMYLAIEPSISLDDLIKYITPDDARSILLARANLMSQGWYESATTAADGETPKPFDEAEFVKYASEFSARGMSKDEIEDAIKAAWEALHALLINVNIAPEEKQSQALLLSEKVRNLNVAKDARKKKKEEPVVAE